MNVKEIIGNIIGYIPPQTHNHKLRELRDSLQSLIESRERQVVDLQSELHTCKKKVEELDELRNVNQKLTAKIQSLRRDADERMTALEQASREKEEMINNLISFFAYANLLKVNSEMSLEDGLRLLMSKYEDILSALGITIVKEFSGMFDASCQKVVGTKQTDDSSLINNVAEVVNPGYFVGDKCLQPMEVIVYCK